MAEGRGQNETLPLCAVSQVCQKYFFLNRMQVPGIHTALNTPACEKAKGFVHQLSDPNTLGISQTGKLHPFPGVDAIIFKYP